MRILTPSDNDNIIENYKQICNNIQEAKAKYRLPLDEITIMAVTKTVDVEKINFAVASGITLLGENRVQEFLSKKDLYDKKASVHFIGNLQTNKVKYIIQDVDMIQSVDSKKIANEINKQAFKLNKVMEICLEVNIGNEPTKSGFLISEVRNALEELSQLDNIKICGLMAIPPINANEKLYETMQKLFIDIQSENMDNVYMTILSIGMSNDYETAVKYGSNLVRIGSKLFGARK